MLSLASFLYRDDGCIPILFANSAFVVPSSEQTALIISAVFIFSLLPYASHFLFHLCYYNINSIFIQYALPDYGRNSCYLLLQMRNLCKKTADTHFNCISAINEFCCRIRGISTSQHASSHPDHVLIVYNTTSFR